MELKGCLLVLAATLIQQQRVDANFLVVSLYYCKFLRNCRK